MIYKLPSDLQEVEMNLTDSLCSYLDTYNEMSYLSVNLKFDGLRINPIIFRLSNKLIERKYSNLILYPDAGGAALAKRDYPKYSENIFTFKEYVALNEIPDSLLLICSPQPYDIELFENICSVCNSTIIMINGKLEDPIVGIGSVGREMRKRFAYKWKTIYYIQPLSKGALLNKYPNDWELYKMNNSLYTYVKSFSNKPDDETILLNL